MLLLPATDGAPSIRSSGYARGWGAFMRTAVFVAAMAVLATLGETLIASAMAKAGDLGELRERAGLTRTILRVVSSAVLWLGIACMACSFFALLAALSHANLSLVAPATNALTFVATAVAGRLVLHERVDGKRWVSVILICAGVALMSF